MTLRRTGIARKTELRRGPVPRRVRESTTRPGKTTARARARTKTGPTAAQRRVVAERAGWCCEICPTLLHDGNTWTQAHSFHHRLPRRMGGTSRPDVNAAYALLLLCGTGTTGCHGYVESNRQEAYAMGWLLHDGQNPADVPVVVMRVLTGPVLLTADGHYQEVTPDA